MEARRKQKKKMKDVDELQPPSPRSKVPIRAGSNSVFACLPTTALRKPYSMGSLSPDNSFRLRTGHSGPLISIIPKEARSSKKGAGFDSQEPTSPKVSCIGQVKLKKKHGRKAKEGKHNYNKGKHREISPLPAKETRTGLGKMSKLRRFFSAKQLPVKSGLDEPSEAMKEGKGNNHPSLGQMKRYASTRESAALANIYRDSEDFMYKKDASDTSEEEDAANFMYKEDESDPSDEEEKANEVVD